MNHTDVSEERADSNTHEGHTTIWVKESASMNEASRASDQRQAGEEQCSLTLGDSTSNEGIRDNAAELTRYKTAIDAFRQRLHHVSEKRD